MTLPRIARHTLRAFMIGMLAMSIPLLTACTGLMGGTSALQGSWVLVSGSDAEGTFVDAVQPITLVFEGDTVSGQAPCNPYSGPVIRGPGANGSGGIELGGLERTEMGCAEMQQNLLESRYFAALEAVDRVVVEGDALELTGDGEYLRFMRIAD